MNISLMRLKPVVAELRGIRLELARMNAIKELELAHQGLYYNAPIADTSGEAPEVFYVNEEADALREIEEALGKRAKEDETRQGESQ